MDPRMDFSPEKRRLVGDLKNVGSLLRELSESFKGVVRIRMSREQKSYEAELILQNNFIIAASLKCPAESTRIFGEKAFREMLDYIKESSGEVVAYELSDDGFKSYLSGNEASLLELVRDLGKTLEDIGRVDEDIRKEGLFDLETQWKDLETRWKQFEEREKPYLEMILKEDLRDRSYSKGVVDGPVPEKPSEENLEHKDVPVIRPDSGETGKETNPSFEEPTPTTSAGNPQAADVDSQKAYAASSKSMEDSSDEKTLDEMILREDPWERITEGSSVVAAEEKEWKEEAAPKTQESAETEERKKADTSSEKTLSDDFNERVRDAILGRTHHRITEKDTSAHETAEPAVKSSSQEKSPAVQMPKASPDEWMTRANATLQRLKKKKEETLTMPSAGSQKPGDESAQATAPAQVQDELSQQNDVAPEDMESGTHADEEQTPITSENINESSEELIDKTTSEISDLNKNVDVYWGWDKRKKRFVGIEGTQQETAGNPPEENKVTAQANELKAPLPSSAVPQEEPNKQQAQREPQAREIVIKKEELIQAAQAAAAPKPQQPPQPKVPEFKRKIGLMDKLKYAKYPQIIKVMEKVDGKRTIDDLAKETKLTPASVGYIVEKLTADGYVNIKNSERTF